MKNKIKVLLIIFINIFLIKNTVALEQNNEDKYNINYFQDEINELNNYFENRSKLKDIKFFEKKLELYKYLEKQEKERLKTFNNLKKCLEENRECVFSGIKSNELKLEKLDKKIIETDENIYKYKKEIKNLKENLEYLHKGEREIKLKNKFEGKKDKFEAEKSDYIKNDKKEIIDSKQKKESKKLDSKKKMEKKLNDLMKKYNKKDKIKIYKKILSKLEKLENQGKIIILKEIIKIQIVKYYNL